MPFALIFAILVALDTLTVVLIQRVPDHEFLFLPAVPMAFMLCAVAIVQLARKIRIVYYYSVLILCSPALFIVILFFLGLVGPHPAL